MSGIFHSLLASELLGFLQFKRSFGYGYMRAEFTLREFDRFLIEYVAVAGDWIKQRSPGYRASLAVKRLAFPATQRF